MYRATFQRSLDDPWRFMDPIRVGWQPTVGPQPTGEPEPDACVTVERHGTPVARIDAYADHRGAFEALIAWDRFVVLGWDAVVHLIDPLTRHVRDIACDGYFGHLYPLGDRLLIASASELICVGDGGDVVWRRGELGIDGVIVESTGDDVVSVARAPPRPLNGHYVIRHSERVIPNGSSSSTLGSSSRERRTG